MGLQAFSPISLRQLTLKNRFIKTAAYEGMCDKGMPTQRLIDHHVRIAQGDVALTTVSYGAVNADGRTHGEQMYMHEGVMPMLGKLTKEVHKAGGAASIQLTHCGFFTQNSRVQDRRPFAPSKVLNKYGLLKGIVFSREMNAEELAGTRDDFARSAAMAQAAGFDAVELHMGHGYLLSQFLSPYSNRRTDNYGGNPANRMRFPLEVVEAVRRAVGEQFPVLCKINLDDGFKGGVQIDDTIEFAQALEAAGVDALVMSGGFTSKTPYYLMRGGVPWWQMVMAERNVPTKIAMALFSRIIIQKYEFQENFFLPLARRIRQVVDMPLAYLGGVVSRNGVDQLMKEGFDMVAIGRALIHDPDFILKLKQDLQYVSPCDHCNLCVTEMDRGGVRCVLENS
jgi:2,4-dienoyl-CoA reductase-like NADH-dependent reductase (Old Yellow Enzyme family)